MKLLLLLSLAILAAAAVVNLIRKNHRLDADFRRAMKDLFEQEQLRISQTLAAVPTLIEDRSIVGRRVGQIIEIANLDLFAEFCRRYRKTGRQPSYAVYVAGADDNDDGAMTKPPIRTCQDLPDLTWLEVMCGPGDYWLYVQDVSSIARVRIAIAHQARELVEESR